MTLPTNLLNKVNDTNTYIIVDGITYEVFDNV
jgi:hypothetical protein